MKFAPRRNSSTTARRLTCCCIARAPTRPRFTIFICASWRRLREIHPFVGYSGHERGIAVSIGAVAMGAFVHRTPHHARPRDGRPGSRGKPGAGRIQGAGVRHSRSGSRARRKTSRARAQPGRTDQPREPRQEPGGRARHCRPARSSPRATSRSKARARACRRSKCRP